METIKQKNQKSEITKKSEEKIISEKQKVSEIQTEDKQKTEKIDEAKKEVEKTEEQKKPEIQNKKIIKKNEAVVNIQNAPVSTKFSMAICKFIKYKEIEKAIKELEQVLVYKKAIPMRGGVGHKKSAGRFASGSGKYPMNTAKYFITLLKSLSANATANGLENPIITEAFANIGQKPRARFGRWQRKRSHIRLVAKNKIKKADKNKKEQKDSESKLRSHSPNKNLSNEGNFLSSSSHPEGHKGKSQTKANSGKIFINSSGSQIKEKKIKK